MSSPSSLLLPENGDDWPIRMFVFVTPWAWAAPPANKQASAPTAAVNARIVFIALSPHSWGKAAAEISALWSWKLRVGPVRARARKAQPTALHEACGLLVRMPPY